MIFEKHEFVLFKSENEKKDWAYLTIAKAFKSLHHTLFWSLSLKK